ncbi:histidine kinase [Streptosporangium sp. 'caverna']|uniref:sensor histidine kinase n=1 Tax=Streptosporangium sp. 'caverna' TaxID=2202249 RepID=UPI000D7D4E24|nr:histidine kinase [Streptosporangium sp. 'caverna']AWS46111.1 two-component sensor histidine kinase [Streptosporangium sp. 'caverna']
MDRIDLVPRLARTVVVAVLGGFASVYVLAGLPSPAPVLIAVAAFLVQAAYVLTDARPWWLLAVQAGLGCLGVLGFGMSVGMLGFVAGSLLLTAAWPAAALVVAAAGAISLSPDATITTLLIALVIYGLVRMIELVDDLFAARLELAMAAVAEERLQIAAELNAGVGRSLAIVGGLDPERPEMLGEILAVTRQALTDARAAAVDYRSLSLAPDTASARALLLAAGVEIEVRVGHTEPLGPTGALLAAALRDAVSDAVRHGTARHCLIETSESEDSVRLRIVHDAPRTAVQAADALSEAQARIVSAHGTLTLDLAPDGRLTIDARVPKTPPARPATIGAATGTRGEASGAGAGGRLGGVFGRLDAGRLSTVGNADSAYRLSVWLLAAVLMGFCAKALLRVTAETLVPVTVCLGMVVFLHLISVRGRHPWNLLVMAALTYLPIPAFGSGWLVVAGFLAGPLLLALPPVAAWPMVAGVMGSVAGIGVTMDLDPGVVVNLTISTLVTGLVVYGLGTLARLVKELQTARERLASAAVVQERLRTARDLHDLLGHSLAAILLKCELARRLADRDPDRARAELADVVEMAGRAVADMRGVSGDGREMSLEVEAESARSVLAAAGIEVELDLSHDRLPPQVATVLSAVLREAVTNVLRHSSARRCVIRTTSEGLSVANDGVSAARKKPGSGIGNLTTRLAALDAGLTIRTDGGWFELRAVLDPARLGGDADRVGAVAGVELGHDGREVVADCSRG